MAILSTLRQPRVGAFAAVSAIALLAVTSRRWKKQLEEPELNGEARATAAVTAAAAAIRAKEGNDRLRGKGRVDKQFFVRLIRLLRIVVPGIASREAILLGALSLVLVVRTFLSIIISSVNGSIVESIVRRDFTQFVRRLLILGSISIPASTVNSLLKYLDNSLALRFRQRLVKMFHDEYLDGIRFYQVSNIDSRISNPDQALTETIKNWGSALSALYSNVSKPLLDIVMFSVRLSELMGVQGPATVIVYYIVTGVLIRMLSPGFGRLTAEMQKFEGIFRYCHNRIITSAEEIAFYGGGRREKVIVNSAFQDIVRHSNTMYFKQFTMGIADQFLIKYGAVMLGYAVLGLPVFGPSSESYNLEVQADPSRITRDYIRNSSLLINLAGAIGRIVVSHKKLQELAGYTALVSELEQVLSDLSMNKYERQMVNSKRLADKNLAPFSGKIEYGDNIELRNAAIVSPNGDVLLEDLSFQLSPGQNLLVAGPNGCGKTSILRVVGQIWPLWGGLLKKPEASSVFYIPQKPYLAAGSLRDQVIYPHSVEERACSDEVLYKLLSSVKLQYLVDREGWDAVQVWADVLSGGEKQRIAMARLFYHRPKFAILDECTSAVSVDVEGYISRWMAKAVGHLDRSYWPPTSTTLREHLAVQLETLP